MCQTWGERSAAVTLPFRGCVAATRLNATAIGMGAPDCTDATTQSPEACRLTKESHRLPGGLSLSRVFLCCNGALSRRGGSLWARVMVVATCRGVCHVPEYVKPDLGKLGRCGIPNLIYACPELFGPESARKCLILGHAQFDVRCGRRWSSSQFNSALGTWQR